ncbi:hypothetical protein ACP3T3_20015 [Chryseobacterium sp. CBSDS_008]|uniref:hypothetical protein n=1 Tax=Chryseobacterium sp. CBSDS_008 TaxID=3415265 RepID=UPI003CF45E20
MKLTVNRFFDKYMDTLIQIVILACLFIIIILLAIDKVKIIKSEKAQEPKQTSAQLPDIMGKTHQDRENRRILVDEIDSNIVMSTEIDQDKKNIETGLSQVAVTEVPADPLEDEDLSDDDFPPYDNRFSQGVSLEELMNVGKLLQQSDLASEQENVVLDIMQKIQGTELYDHLEHSIGDASKRVAALLDQNLKGDESGGFDPGDSFDKFNINDFI